MILQEETLLRFEENNPCWTEGMIALAGGRPENLKALLDAGFLEREGEVYSLTFDGAARFRQSADESFLPLNPGFSKSADRRREANRSLLQLLLDKRHMQRWGLKEYVKPFRFELPDIVDNELFSLEGGSLAWRYPENPVFKSMARDFPLIGLAARGKPPLPEHVVGWMDKNAPRRRTMEADLLYKSRYDFQSYTGFPKLPCDPCELLNTDRFFCFFAPLEDKNAMLEILGEFHMFMAMMRRMYLPGYVDLDSMDQDGINWLIYVCEREEDALECVRMLTPLGRALAGPPECLLAGPMEIWSLSLEALRDHGGTVESIHDLLPYVAHPIWRVE